MRGTAFFEPLAAFAVVLFVGDANTVFAHCDGMDGPVVQAARRALKTGDVNHVLVWVQKSDEAEIGRAFDNTLAVRKLGAQAKELADTYFFETVVRIHRAGEGASYTGLKPAGRDLGPAIPAADRALESGSVALLASLVAAAVKEGLREHFVRAMEKKKFEIDDVQAGREYVEAYVELIHYVERLYEATQSAAHGHFTESQVEEH